MLNHNLRFQLPILSAVLFTAGLATAAYAQPQAGTMADPWNAPHFSVAPQALYRAASAMPVLDGINIVELCEDETYTFDEAGRMAHTGHFVYKVITQKGAESWDSLSVGWAPWHQARPTIRARVITPDFVVHTLDPKTITEAPARGGDYKTYSDGKQLRAPLPAIAPGAVIEGEYSETETEPLFAAGRTGRSVLGEEGIPVAHSRIVFEAPAALPLETRLYQLPGIKPVRTESAGRVTLTIDVGTLDGIEKADPNLPPDYLRFPMIEFSTGPSWQRIAAEYAKIVDEHADTAAVKAAVAPLIAGKKTDAEKEAAILDFIGREVRYTGIEFGEAALVPHDPSETLAKKYGDCKDKSTLLAMMLRAAGIPAHVALLNVGNRKDVSTELPGMGMFDHAIVYVPGKNPLWIDATDRYSELGQLPISDQGRLALIASAATTALVKIPESGSKDNGLVESREITLTDSGPANIVEITRPRGIYSSSYRGYYADKPDKDTREGLSDYVKAEYVSENLTKVERTDPADLSRSFELTLACEKARRGYTGLENAQAAIRLDRIFQLLPADLKRKDDADTKKNNGADKPKTPRTVDWWFPVPFTTEWNYRITPPAGFVAKELPKDAMIEIGPARLTEKFSSGKDGAVLAHFIFDSVRHRYTAAEAAALRNRVAELIAGPAIMVNFEPEGAALLREGKVKEALASYRNMIARNPNAAVHHLQVANVLLNAGMGEAAREEARQAVKLDPNSATAELVLADILKHDLVGRNLRAGSDLEGAAEAYRAAARLDPDDDTVGGNLAILFEYDPVGRRYSGQAKMKDAIAEYRKLGQNKLDDLGIANNLAFALFYGGDYDGAYKAAQALNPQPKALMAASMAMLQGSKAGLAEANKQSTDDNSRKETARTAGEMLMNMRQYVQAADFYQAGAAGDSAAHTLALANMLRGAPHHEDVHFDNTPAGLARRYALTPFSPSFNKDVLTTVLSRNAVKVLNAMDADALKDVLDTGKQLNSQMAREDSSLDVTEDIMLQSADPKVEGNDTTGYRVKMSILSASTMTVYIVKEDGQYKLLDTDEKPNAIGLEIVDRVQTGDLKSAKTMLDWMREDQHLAGGDDPYGGPVFPRFWTKGAAADAQRMKLAAAAIMVGTKPTVAKGVAVLEDGLKDATSDRERDNIRLALSHGYYLQENYSKLLDAASELLRQEPESKQAFTFNVAALEGLKRYDEAMKLCDERMRRLENDTDAIETKMEVEVNRGNYTAARVWAQMLADLGKEDAMLLNNVAWYSLFTGKVSDSDVDKAIRATQKQKDTPGFLHTLACLYAETGKTTEAHDVLLRAMDDWNLDEPNDEVWYVLGRVAEDYGEHQIAIADYRKLKRPTREISIPTSTWKLAHMRLKAMGAETAAQSN